MPEAIRDRFANIATFKVTMSAANTISFAELLTGAGIDSSRRKATALIIDEIDYYIPSGAGAQMTTAADLITYGITISNSVDDLQDMSDQNILDSGFMQRVDFGSAASAGMVRVPFVKQFFPPVITAEKRLYLGCNTVGFASAQTMRARMYYRTVEITSEEFVEISEVFRLVG